MARSRLERSCSLKIERAKLSNLGSAYFEMINFHASASSDFRFGMEEARLHKERTRQSWDLGVFQRTSIGRLNDPCWFTALFIL